MKNKKFISISNKLIFALASSTSLALLLSMFAIFAYTINTEKDNGIQSLSQLTKIMGKNLIATIEFDDMDSANSILNTLELDKNIEAAFIFNSDKSTFASYIALGKQEEISLELTTKVYETKNIEDNLDYIDMEYMLASSPIYFQDKYLGTFCIVSNTNKLKETIQEQFFVLLMVFLTSMAIIFALALRIEQIFTSPIFQMKDAMESISSNANYDVHIEDKRNDEFNILYDGFNNMIDIIEDRTTELHKQKEFVQTLLDSQEQLIITTDGDKLKSVNATFLDFFAVDSVEEFIKTYDANCIGSTFNKNTTEGYLQNISEYGKWIDYVIFEKNQIHKVAINREGIDFIFSVTAAKISANDGLKSAVFTNITEMERAKQEIEAIHKHTRDSIEYASLIQGALMPEESAFKNYFQDYFTIWHPKDLVGGDIYLFDELRNDDECLLMVIDCTGHGVAGAFVTMLVKAIERQITGRIKHSDEIVSPAKILSIFNKSMKHLLKQESKESISNAGFDGGIVYYNKKEKIIKYAGSETPLFYIEDDELKMLKGTRYSVGYKSCDVNYEYKEHIVSVTEGMSFYLSTDGYLDQNGGEKSFPFGKKRFQNIIKKHHTKVMLEQQEIFLNELDSYQGNEESNDDITLIGFKI